MPEHVALGAASIAGAGILAVWFPGVDITAVIGAFGGSLIFVASSKSTPVFERVLYLFAGWIGGYFGCAEILAYKWAQTSGIAAFLSGLVCVLLANGIISYLTTGKAPDWLATIISRFIGKGKTE